MNQTNFKRSCWNLFYSFKYDKHHYKYFILQYHLKSDALLHFSFAFNEVTNDNMFDIMMKNKIEEIKILIKPLPYNLKYYYDYYNSLAYNEKPIMYPLFKLIFKYIDYCDFIIKLNINELFYQHTFEYLEYEKFIDSIKYDYLDNIKYIIKRIVDLRLHTEHIIRIKVFDEKTSLLEYAIDKEAVNIVTYVLKKAKYIDPKLSQPLIKKIIGKCIPRKKDEICLYFINLLISYGCSINFVDKFGSTPLNWAVDRSLLMTTKLLIQHTIDIDSKSILVGPLISFFQCTSIYGNNISPSPSVKFVKLLIENGAKIPNYIYNEFSSLIKNRQNHMALIKCWCELKPVKYNIKKYLSNDLCTIIMHYILDIYFLDLFNKYKFEINKDLWPININFLPHNANFLTTELFG
jgi:hypothetical protein